MDHKSLFSLAKRELGLTQGQIAGKLGASQRDVARWARSSASLDTPLMPFNVREQLLELLARRKLEYLEAGNRFGAEVIDAISARLDPAILRKLLTAFDSLQRFADAASPMVRLPNKPHYFRTMAEKNAWDEREVLWNARRNRAKGRRGHVPWAI